MLGPPHCGSRAAPAALETADWGLGETRLGGPNTGVRHDRKFLREYPVKGLRLKPPRVAAVTGGGTALYRLDDLMSKMGGGREVAVRPDTPTS